MENTARSLERKLNETIDSEIDKALLLRQLNIHKHSVDFIVLQFRMTEVGLHMFGVIRQ